MICLNWNTRWAESGSQRGKLIRDTIRRLDPDVMCLTESTLSMVPKTGHSILSSPDYGYPNNGTRRKVLLWSKTPWSGIDLIGSPQMPGGRFVSGTTKGVRFIGICIPWKDAHVRTGRLDRTPWEDHLAYLAGLASVVKRHDCSEVPLCVIGDYNQPIPRVRQPIRVAEALADVLDDQLIVATSGMLDPEGRSIIDHFAHSRGSCVEIAEIVPRNTLDGIELTDHVGIVASIIIC